MLALLIGLARRPEGVRGPTGVVVRKARKSESGRFLRLLVELAKYERLEPPSASARRRIVRDIFGRRRLSLLLALLDGDVVGYALYFFSYSSFLARPTLYLEDLYVAGDSRRSGIGSALFASCASEARRAGCGRMEWAVLRWNSPAVDFYEKLGADRLDEWAYYRLDRRKLRGLARGVNIPSRRSPLKEKLRAGTKRRSA